MQQNTPKTRFVSALNDALTALDAKNPATFLDMWYVLAALRENIAIQKALSISILRLPSVYLWEEGASQSMFDAYKACAKSAIKRLA